MRPPPSLGRLLQPWRILVATLLLALSVLAQAASAEVPGALTRLGEQAIASFDRQLDPLPIKITIVDWDDREAGVIERAQMRRIYVAAIEGLIAQAAGSGEKVDEIGKALKELAQSGRSLGADRLFAAQAEAAEARGEAGRADAALAWRHSVALTELPVAMATRPGRLDAHKGSGKVLHDARTAMLTSVRGRTGEPMGALALSSLERAARLDGSDPWAWIMIAWLGGHDPALPAALRGATASTDDTVALAATQQLAQLLARQGRAQDAGRLYIAAIQRTEQAAARLPQRATDAQNFAFALHRAAEFLRRQGRLQAAQEAMQRVLRLRELLAAADPDDSRRQWDLIATHFTLATLPHTDGETNHLSSAVDLATALKQRYRFVPMFDGKSLPGLSAIIFMLGGVLALVIGIGLLGLYRWRVGRWMRAAMAGDALPAPVWTEVAAALPEPQTALSLHPLPDDSADRTPRSSALAAAATASRRAGFIQALAGLAFGLAASVMYYRLGNLVFRPWGFAIQVWGWSMPIVVVLCLLWTGDRRRQVTALAAYAAVVAVLCARITFSDTPPISVESVGLLPQPVTLLLLALIGPQWQMPMLLLPAWGQVLFGFWSHAHQLAPLLLFLSRYIRAIAPTIVTLFILLCAGAVLSTIAFSSWAGIQLKVRLAAAGLPYADAELTSALIGALLAAPLAWLVGQGLAAAHRAKWLNDQSLLFDTIWLFQTLFLFTWLSEGAGVSALAAFAAFGTYKAVAMLGMRGVTRAARARPPARLLLLRVFGQRRRSERLLDVLAARWRYAGPIQLIGAPDVATRTVDPDEFMDFLSGRLRRQFVIDPQDLPRRIAEVDMLPDADGRFRINDVFCGNDTWQAAVRALMSASDLCLMDLRGFSKDNSGCMIELQALLELVPARAIVLLIDRSTDQPLLECTLGECQARLLPGSLNAGGPTQLATLDASGSELHSVRRLLLAADAVLTSALEAVPPQAAPRTERAAHVSAVSRTVRPEETAGLAGGPTAVAAQAAFATAASTSMAAIPAAAPKPLWKSYPGIIGLAVALLLVGALAWWSGRGNAPAPAGEASGGVAAPSPAVAVSPPAAAGAPLPVAPTSPAVREPALPAVTPSSEAAVAPTPPPRAVVAPRTARASRERPADPTEPREKRHVDPTPPAAQQGEPASAGGWGIRK